MPAIALRVYRLDLGTQSRQSGSPLTLEGKDGRLRVGVRLFPFPPDDPRPFSDELLPFCGFLGRRSSSRLVHSVKEFGHGDGMCSFGVRRSTRGT